MDLDGLLAQARQRRDCAFGQVLMDALLEARDPRGELIAACMGGGDPAQAFAGCIARVRAAVPAATHIQIQHGLVTRIAVPHAEIATIPAAWLASEPLACVAIELPGDDETLPPLDALRGAHGVELSGATDQARWAALRGALEALRPRALRLKVHWRGGEKREPFHPEWSEWSWLQELAIAAPAAIVAHVLRHTPALARLVVRGAEVEGWLAQAQALEHLRHLDVRTLALDARAVAALGRVTIVHESLGLSPPEEVFDVFGDGGLHWDDAAPLTRRAAAFPFGDAPTFAAVHGGELRYHLNDQPTFRARREVDITALATLGDDLVLGGADGGVERWRPGDRSVVPIARLSGPIRRIDVRGEDLMILHDGGWWRSEGRVVTEGPERPTAMLWHEHGVVRAIGSAIHFDGEDRAIELRDPIRALASDGAKLYALVDGQVLAIDTAAGGVSFLGAYDRRGPFIVAARDGAVAWAESQGTVHIRRGDKVDSAYYSSYSQPDLPMRVADLAIGDDATTLVAFEDGGMNLLLGNGQALKVDPFAGDPHLRWIFIYGGQILVAD
jgi:hypothetical protein